MFTQLVSIGCLFYNIQNKKYPDRLEMSKSIIKVYEKEEIHQIKISKTFNGTSNITAHFE